jgi:hypothetical protein
MKIYRLRCKIFGQYMLFRMSSGGEISGKLENNLLGINIGRKLMSMIKCGSCGNEISPKAATCPKCGHPNEKLKHLSGGQVLLFLALAGGILWFFAGGGLEKQTADQMQKIENQVANDAVNQYQIAKRQGNPIQVCVQAGLVSAAYLQAKDETNYRQWKTTESEDCKRAGVSR